MSNPILELLPSSQRPPLRLVQRSFVPEFREVGHGYRPGQSLGVSIAAHLLAMAAVFLAVRIAALTPVVVTVNTRPEIIRNTDVIFLPTLGGGSEGNGTSGGGQGKAGKVSSALQAQSTRGLAYPGPQPIISNPPGATRGIQTILQPALVNPPLIKQVLKLPNLVPASPVMPELARTDPVMVVKGGRLAIRPESSGAAPKITLPASGRASVVGLTEAHPLMPKPAAPDAVKASEITAVQRDRKGLLVLNAIPPPPDVKDRIPPREARSLFAVIPSDTVVLSEPSAGSKTGGQAAMAAGAGVRNDAPRGDAVAEALSGGNKPGSPARGSGAGSGDHHGNGEGQGLSSENGSGKGRGTSSGSELGTADTHSSGTGGGAGSAPGSGGFHGITIQGAGYGNGNQGSMVVAAPRSPKSYEMNIVSTGNSGGGLPDVGVFRNEMVYTVYLDMRSDELDTTPSWTLQYSVLRPESEGADAMPTHGTPTPPFATLKDVPEFPSEVVRQCGRQQILVTAIMNKEGKLANVAVLRSPVAEVVAPLIEALQHWMFQPAQIDGQPVALKILLGARVMGPR